MAHKGRRAGFGLYYAACMLALVLLGGTTLLGWLGTRQGVAGETRLEGATDMRIAGESCLALALATLEQWSNHEGGPLYEGKPLARLFREDLLEGKEVDMALDPKALGVADFPGSDRYELDGGTVALRIQQATAFGHGFHQGGGRLVVSLRLRDRRGEQPTMRFREEHAYTVTMPTVPRPFDELFLAVRFPRDLIGDHDGNVIKAVRAQGRVLDDARQMLEDLKKARAQSGLPAFDGAIAELETLVPALAPSPAPALAAWDGSEVLVAYPATGRSLDLGRLAVANQVRSLESESRDAGAREDQAAAAIEDAVNQISAHPEQLGTLEGKVHAWVEAARVVHGAGDAVLGLYRDLDQQVLVLGGGFAGKLDEHWSDLSLPAWKERAHYVIQGSTSEELDAELRKLTREVSPINGVIYVENPNVPLTLRGAEQGLTGRFVLAAEGPVVLDGFRPQAAGGAAGDRTRAMVVAGGAMEIHGRVEAALHPRAELTVGDGAEIRGALYALRLGTESHLAGTLAVLEDPESFHRFQSVTGTPDHLELWATHLFVAIDPVARCKDIRHA